jgi:AP-3 complex subunit mu
MIQSFFLLNTTGEVLIEKHWRGVTSRSVCDFFWDEVNKYESKEEMPPVVATSKYYLVSIYRQEMFLLVTSTGETNPLSAMEFLHRVFDIMEEYFGTVEEATIKENFATVYQLLEEMMDFGYPLTTGKCADFPSRLQKPALSKGHTLTHPPTHLHSRTQRAKGHDQASKCDF